MNPMSKKTIMLSAFLALSMSLVACGGQEQPAAEPAKTTEAPAPAEPAAPAASEASADTAEPAASEPATPAEETPATSEATTEAPAQAEPSLAADAGQKRYESTCKVCHDQGLLDAPKINDKASWETRIQQGKETLYTHSIKGFNKMPAQAVGDVSEAEVKAAVDYMLSQAGVS